MSERRSVAIFGSSATEPDSREWADAERAGARCAEAGLAVITGGYSGTMEAVSKGASLAGGHVIGVTAPELFSSRPAPNEFVNEEIVADSLGERIGILTGLASGVLVLPGSIGTAAELVVSWNLNHVGRSNGGQRLPTVAVGREWHDLWRLVTERLGGFGEDVEITDTADEAVDWLLAQPEVARVP